MTVSQQAALEKYFSEYGVAYDAEVLDWPALFANQAPLILEIGFGMGASLLEMAIANPQENFIGIEVHAPGVGKLLSELAGHKQNNVRVMQHDAVEILRHCIAENTLNRIQIFFPDPWPKKRHHKRRLIQPAFLDLCHRVLKNGGTLHLATDWENYAEHMLDVLTMHPGFQNTLSNADYAPRPAYRPMTKFEKRGLRLGHGVWDLIYESV